MCIRDSHRDHGRRLRPCRIKDIIARVYMLSMRKIKKACTFFTAFCIPLLRSRRIVAVSYTHLSHNWFSGTYTRFVPNETVDEERGQGREIRLDDSNIIGGDPGFCDASQRDFRLREDSVCRGMGCEAAPECIRRCHKAAFRLGADKAVLTRMPGDRNIGAL